MGFLRACEVGMAVNDLCRNHGLSEASYCLWRSTFGRKSVLYVDSSNDRFGDECVGPPNCYMPAPPSGHDAENTRRERPKNRWTE